jgi:sterol desaturase/sphingolipid hydroxylase (fatty acid hydroxylase superfamily)
MQAPGVPASPTDASSSSRPTWLSAPRRFPLGRQRIIGPIVLATSDWSRPQAGEPRMFDQAFLEWFSHVHPATLPAIYVPASIWITWLGLQAGISMPASAMLFVAGLVLWTFMEYMIHRYSFHFAPRGRIGVILAYLIHGVHHAYPEDHRRWVVPPVVSIPIALLLYFTFRLVLGRFVNPLGAGVAIGYCVYDLMHYFIHRGRMKSRIGRFLRSHHMQHHYSTPARRFGVSTPFWDYVFRTDR